MERRIRKRGDSARIEGRSTAIIPCLLTAKVHIYLVLRQKSNNSLLSLRYIAAIKLTLYVRKTGREILRKFREGPPLITLRQTECIFLRARGKFTKVSPSGGIIKEMLKEKFSVSVSETEL